METIDYTGILSRALAAAANATPERGLGCGRIYVCVVDKAHGRGIAKAAKALGRIYQTRGYGGASNVLYIGYDNCDGKALAAGTIVANALKAHGIQAYRDEYGD